RKVKIKVNKNKNASHILYKGQIFKNVSVGSYIKIIKGFTEIIGKIEEEFITSEITTSIKYNKKQGIEYEKEENKIVRYLGVSLFGHFNGEKFEQGIREMPLIDNECYALDKDEFNKLHQFYEGKEQTLKIGHLTEEASQKIEISINKLFASHIGVFGNTGSGKSNTLARIYHELFKKMKDNATFKEKSKFIIIDFNGEYGKNKEGEEDSIIAQNKKVYFLDTNKERGCRIPFSEKDLIDVELISILANATEKTQKPFIKRAINLFNKVRDKGLEYFKNILKYRLKLIFGMTIKDKAHILLDYVKLVLDFDKLGYEHKGNNYEWHNTCDYFYLTSEGASNGQIGEAGMEKTNIYKAIDSYKSPSNAITKVIHFLYLQLIFDVYNDKAQNDHIAPAINKLKSKQGDIEKVLATESKDNIFPETRNLIVLHLKHTSLDIKKILPLIIIRKLYNDHKGSDDFKSKSLHIIIDEAHNILSSSSERESETWKDYRLETFEEIIKEGRKFNVFLTIASQRPHDISPTIISQLSNHFIHRLINDFDIDALRKTVAYLDKLSIESIPILATGSCFFTGQASNIPVKVTIDHLEEEYRPNSETVELTKIWKKPSTS
ncbi:MAG: ATP-binding protein, partial [SAR324 cluster bacterium]|nr:ATP-binding protein [SAR324 cluster bacterium]